MLTQGCVIILDGYYYHPNVTRISYCLMYSTTVPIGVLELSRDPANDIASKNVWRCAIGRLAWALSVVKILWQV